MDMEETIPATLDEIEAVSGPIKRRNHSTHAVSSLVSYIAIPTGSAYRDSNYAINLTKGSEIK
jgi:hypothetical protein